MVKIDKTTPISSPKELIDWIAVGEKPKASWRVGTEHEKVLFRKKGHNSIPYEGDNGVKALLNGLKDFGCGEAVMEFDKIIGLTDQTGASISLEPGGQFELSGAPLETIHQTHEEVDAHLKASKLFGDQLDIGFLQLGMAPTYTRETVSRMPKGRYKIMTNYMPKVGSLGLDMMYRTATIQANLDFSSEEDMIKKMRVSLALQPIATALFANSPFTNGVLNGHLSQRSFIWLDTDPNRTGMLDFVFEDGFGYERYIQWILDVPMYFVKRGDTYHDVAGASFKDFMHGKLKGFEGEIATFADWEDHLTTAFPEVRLKRYIEVRGADMGPQSHITALSALWAGLLYYSPSLESAWAMVKDWNAEERRALRYQVPKTALKTPFRNQLVLDLAESMVDLAWEGLKARNIKDLSGKDETQYLEPLKEIIQNKKTLAEVMIERYKTEWNGSLEPIFSEYTF